MKLIFCHGLESAPHGRKYHALRAAGLEVDAPDFRGQSLADRVSTLCELLSGQAIAPVVVGSSYGGITAALAAMRAPVHRLVLCAPALAVDEPPANATRLRPGAPTVIIHGTRDEICPIEASRRFADHAEVELLEVDDDHFLHDSLPLIVEQARRGLRP